MNIEYANAIPLRTVFVKLGLEPIMTTEAQLTYQSPFDGQSVLTVNLMLNTWHDTTNSSTGHVIDLVCRYLRHTGEANTIVDALRWLRNMVGYVVLAPPENLPDYSQDDKQIKYIDRHHFSCPGLIKYLEEERAIPFKYARFVLHEVNLLNKITGKHFSALGLKNEEGGFAIRNQYLKSQTGRKYISFIRGQIVKPDGIHIFKDVFDYLSAITNRGGRLFDDDVMILNSLTNMAVSAGFIRGYGYTTAYTWLDNSSTGYEATRNYAAFFRTEPNLIHKPMNKHYAGHKDINEWLVANHPIRF